MGLIGLLLITGATGMMSYTYIQQRNVAIEQALAFSESVHHITIAGLTTLFITQAKKKDRDDFLSQINIVVLNSP